jgi:predicted P-loop ATPase
MKKPITAKVREAVQKATEIVLEENKEVDLFKIIEILEKEYNIKFFNMEVLQMLIKEALEEIVFIYC